MNAHCERLIGTLRRECLDHVIVLGKGHARRLLSDYAAYYNAARSHQALGGDAPEPRERQNSDASIRSTTGLLCWAAERGGPQVLSSMEPSERDGRRGRRPWQRWLFGSLSLIGVIGCIPSLLWLTVGRSLPIGGFRSFIVIAGGLCGLGLFLLYGLIALAAALLGRRRDALIAAACFLVGIIFFVVEVMPPWPT